jgi:hypothetical protein
MTAHTIIPRCPVCGAVNQAWRREWDYFATDEFACKICRTVWYQDPVRPLERLVLVRGKRPVGVDIEPDAPSWWERLKRWFYG